METHLSQVGGASLIRSRGRANGTENPVGRHSWRENEEGVKIIPAQNYAGVDTEVQFATERSTPPHLTLSNKAVLLKTTSVR